MGNEGKSKNVKKERATVDHWHPSQPDRPMLCFRNRCIFDTWNVDA